MLDQLPIEVFFLGLAKFLGPYDILALVQVPSMALRKLVLNSLLWEPFSYYQLAEGLVKESLVHWPIGEDRLVILRATVSSIKRFCTHRNYMEYKFNGEIADQYWHLTIGNLLILGEYTFVHNGYDEEFVLPLIYLVVCVWRMLPRDYLRDCVLPALGKDKENNKVTTKSVRYTLLAMELERGATENDIEFYQKVDDELRRKAREEMEVENQNVEDMEN
jgi:hypothetical protein